jgi:hypothetical protein
MTFSTSTGQPFDIDPFNSYHNHTISGGQNSFVVTVVDKTGFKKNPDYIFVSDRWGTAEDHLMSHDFQFWSLLEFDDNTSPPTPQQLTWLDQCQVDV